MPAKADCVTCHSPKGKVVSECITCHKYHAPPQVAATGMHADASGSFKQMLLGERALTVAAALWAALLQLQADLHASHSEATNARTESAARLHPLSFDACNFYAGMKSDYAALRAAGIKRSIALRSRSQSTGLVKCSANPAARLAATSASIPKPLNAMPVRP